MFTWDLFVVWECRFNVGVFFAKIGSENRLLLSSWIKLKTTFQWICNSTNFIKYFLCETQFFGYMKQRNRIIRNRITRKREIWITLLAAEPVDIVFKVKRNSFYKSSQYYQISPVYLNINDVWHSQCDRHIEIRRCMWTLTQQWSSNKNS